MTVDMVGLCQTCRHATAITNASGSIFYLCRLSEIDARFRKYPSLPVIQCPGYQQRFYNEAEEGAARRSPARGNGRLTTAWRSALFG